jgi:hypothetical protein
MVDGQLSAWPNKRRVSGGEGRVCDIDNEFTAAPRDNSFVHETQVQLAEGHLQPCSRLVVADEEVCDSQCVVIEGTAY